VDKEDTDEVGPTYDTIEENELDPDIYDINVPAWDNLASPLHLAILHGHLETVEELVTSFGADVLLPIKITNDYDKRPKGAIMTLVLVLSLPLEKAREMSKTLLRLGASPAQADMSHQTALQYIAQSDYNELLDIYQEHDGPGMRRAINHLTAMGAAWYSSSFDFASALVNALCAKNQVGAKKLLELGAKPSHDLADWLKAVKSQFPDALLYGREERFAKTHHKQPIVYAIENDLPIAAIDLLQRGADPNTMHQRRHDRDETLLDSTNRYLQELRNCLKKEASSWYPTYGLPDPVIFEQDDSSYFTEFKEGTYKLFSARAQLEEAKENNKKVEEKEAEIAKSSEDKPGEAERREAITEMIEKYELLKAELLSRDAKTWDELHPGETQGPEPEGYRNRTNYMKKPSAKLFKVEFFSSLSGLSDIANEGYVKLYVPEIICFRNI
jgi:ankyrin repeat protein